MATEVQPKIVDEGKEQTLTRSQEETLLGMELIFYCGRCRAYHLEFDVSWDEVKEAAIDCNTD